MCFQLFLENLFLTISKFPYLKMSHHFNPFYNNGKIILYSLWPNPIIYQTLFYLEYFPDWTSHFSYSHGLLSNCAYSLCSTRTKCIETADVVVVTARRRCRRNAAVQRTFQGRTGALKGFVNVARWSSGATNKLWKVNDIARYGKF